MWLRLAPSLTKLPPMWAVAAAGVLGIALVGLSPALPRGLGAFAGPAIAVGPHLSSPDGGHASLVLLGAIGPGAASRFDAATKALKPGDVVFVSSPGGLVGQAMGIGRTLRSRGLSVVVGQPNGALRPGRCVSSCTFVLAAGVSRTVVPGSVIGVHAISAVDGEGTAEGRDRVETTVARYLGDMGVSPGLPDLMARHRDVVRLSWGAAASLGLVNRRPFQSEPS